MSSVDAHGEQSVALQLDALGADLAPDQTDGYDRTDWLLEHRTPVALTQLHALAQK